VLLQVLPDEINNGYHNLSMEIVKSIDNKNVSSIKELDSQILESESEITQIELDSGVTIAINKQNLKKADERISKKFNISKLGRY